MSLALLLALALQGPPDPPQLADLKRAWQESCGDRAYGTFDDVCTQMSDQIRAYERDARREAQREAQRKTRGHPATPAAPAPTASQPAAPAPVASR